MQMLQGSNYNFRGAVLPSVTVALASGSFTKDKPGVLFAELGYFTTSADALAPGALPFDTYDLQCAYVPGEDALATILAAAQADSRFAGYTLISV